MGNYRAIMLYLFLNDPPLQRFIDGWVPALCRFIDTHVY